LRAAIAALGRKHVAGQALRMDANEWHSIPSAAPIAPGQPLHHRHGRLRWRAPLDSENVEVAEARRKFRPRNDLRFSRLFSLRHENFAL